MPDSSPLCFRLYLIIALLFSISAPARAEWEANFIAIGTKKDFPRASGKLFAKGGRLRVDATAPLDMSFYAKADARRVDAAVHSFRIRLRSTIAKLAGGAPLCLAEGFEACVKRFSMRKIREEKCGTPETSRTCEVFTGHRGTKGVKRLELWHWKGEAESVLAKAIVAKTDGSEVRVDFTAIDRRPHPDTFYDVPAGYSDAGPLERFIGDFQGKSE